MPAKQCGHHIIFHSIMNLPFDIYHVIKFHDSANHTKVIAICMFPFKQMEVFLIFQALIIAVGPRWFT